MTRPWALLAALAAGACSTGALERSASRAPDVVAHPTADAATAPDPAPPAAPQPAVATPDAQASVDAPPLLDAQPRVDAAPAEAGAAAPTAKSNSLVDVWIPDGVAVLRGAVVATHHHQLNEIPYQSWRVMCKAWGFAFVGTDHEFLAKDTDAFFARLEQAAAQKGHPELAHVPLVCRGFSAGGGACIRLAKRRAARVIAVVSNGNPGSSFEDSTRDVLRTVPVLTVNGSADPFVHGLEWIPDVYWAKIRSHDLPWGLSVLWKGQHAWGNTNFLLYPFLDRVIRRRLPATYDGRQGPAGLAPLAAQDGWLADIDGWTRSAGTETARPVSPYAAYTGDRRRAVWLPDGYVAAVWRAVSTSAHPLAFVKPSPGSTNTSNTIAVVAANQPLEVELTGAPDGTRVSAGDRPLGTLRGGRLTVPPGVLSVGYHALLAFTDGPDGERAALPRQIFVAGDPSLFGAAAR